ncbi:hypothetical protein ACI2K4_00080 [Micromonospora sp. NPDC050397]
MIEQGRHLGGRPPYGYRLVAAERHDEGMQDGGTGHLHVLPDVRAVLVKV